MAAGYLPADNNRKLPVSTAREQQFKFWERMLLPAIHRSPKITSQNPFYTSHLASFVLLFLTCNKSTPGKWLMDLVVE